MCFIKRRENGLIEYRCHVFAFRQIVNQPLVSVCYPRLTADSFIQCRSLPFLSMAWESQGEKKESVRGFDLMWDEDLDGRRELARLLSSDRTRGPALIRAPRSVCSARLGDHPDADRHRNCQGLADLLETAGRRVNPEDDDRVGILVFGQKVLARGVDCEVAWVLAQRGLVSRGRELAGGRINREDRDAVVAAIRAVEELAGGMDLHLGGVALALETRRQRGDRLDLGESAPVGIVSKGSHRVGHFADDVAEAAAWVKREMARARAQRNGREGWVVRGQRTLAGIELVDENPVQAEVGRDGKPVGLVEVDRMGMGALLPAGVNALALGLDERRGRAQSSIGLDRQAGNAAAAVIGHQDILACPIDGQVAGATANRGLLVQQREYPARRVNAQRADAAPFPAVELVQLVDRVEELAAGMDGEERGIGKPGRHALGRQTARGQVELQQVDALAGRLAVGMGADVEPHRPGCCLFGCHVVSPGPAHGREMERDQEEGNPERPGALCIKSWRGHDSSPRGPGRRQVSCCLSETPSCLFETLAQGASGGKEPPRPLLGAGHAWESDHSLPDRCWYARRWMARAAATSSG